MLRFSLGAYMNICVLGAGYVGLVVGVCMSDRGFHVCCVDTDAEKIRRLEEGKLPIYEPGLDVILSRNVRGGRLSFTTDGASAIRNADVVYIAVGTPGDDSGAADLRWVYAAADQIGEEAEGGTLVIIKSTVPVGTSDAVLSRIREKTETVYDVASNPEFLREGAAISDFGSPDRIVVGYRKKRSVETIRELYRSFEEQGHQILFMDNCSAELTKYAANAMLATRISFMNELSRLCDAVGADIESVRIGTGSDSRIGPKFLNAGIGYGGSCFPKDVKALISTAEGAGLTLQIAQSVEAVNLGQKTRIVDMIQQDHGEDLSGLCVALWGLAFKPDTDDIREAPSLRIIQRLLDLGAEVCAHDPEAMGNVREMFEDRILLCESPLSAAEQADVLVLVTEWDCYTGTDWAGLRAAMRGSVIYDGRNLFDPGKARRAGFRYRGIGRGLESK
jgi:UDPglucose 6-dehydrogenase